MQIRQLQNVIGERLREIELHAPHVYLGREPRRMVGRRVQTGRADDRRQFGSPRIAAEAEDTAYTKAFVVNSMDAPHRVLRSSILTKLSATISSAASRLPVNRVT